MHKGSVTVYLLAGTGLLILICAIYFVLIAKQKSQPRSTQLSPATSGGIEMRNNTIPSNSPMQTTLPTSSNTNATVFPLLYSGIQWEATNTGQIKAQDNKGSTVLFPYSTLATDLRGEPTYNISKLQSNTSYNQEVQDYYTKWFKDNGWDENIEASGGGNGTSFGWTKNGKEFILYFFPNFTAVAHN
jgi:hypothetical protein